MNTTKLRALAALTGTAAVLAYGVPLAPTAHAGDDVRTGGRCSANATWKLKAKPDDGRLEVEGEVDSNRSGQVWRWRLKHDGVLVASGTRTTGGASGSFDVRRLVADHSGTDVIVFRARRPATGEVCRGTLAF